MFRINLDVLNKALNNSVMCLDACVDVAAQRLGGLYNIIFIVFFVYFIYFYTFLAIRCSTESKYLVNNPRSSVKHSCIYFNVWNKNYTPVFTHNLSFPLMKGPR